MASQDVKVTDVSIPLGFTSALSRALVDVIVVADFVLAMGLAGGGVEGGCHVVKEMHAPLFSPALLDAINLYLYVVPGLSWVR